MASSSKSSKSTKSSGTELEEAKPAGTARKELEATQDEDGEDDDELSTDNGSDVEESDEDASSDDSEADAPRNRTGDVPLHWYNDLDHVGYDLEGQKVLKTLKSSEIDNLLKNADDPNAWRTIKDVRNQREVVLTDTDLEVIRRIRSRMFPSANFDSESMVEYENKAAAIHPESRAHPPKRRFLPSKWEAMKVKKLVALMREGKIRPKPPPEPEVFDLWGQEAPERRKGPPPLAAPKMPLPGHAESYNPSPEYLMTEEEKKEWEEMDESERPQNFIPEKKDALRKVGAYKDLVVERFHRCLDLYLVPRALKMRMNVDPASLLPKLPNPKDLRPFPTRISVQYEGHAGLVRGVAVDSTGQWLATASEDKTLRVWEVSSGRPFKVVTFEDAATAVAWCPKHALFAVAAGDFVYFVDPGTDYIPRSEDPEAGPSAESLLTLKPEATELTAEGAEDNENASGKPHKPSKAKIRWNAVSQDTVLFSAGCRLYVPTDGTVQQLVWHHKGSYCAAVSPKALAPSNQVVIHALLQQTSMRPFSKLKGGHVQRVAFHPTKPHFYVATMQSVRIYNLQTQQHLKQLISGAKWISAISPHPSGDHVVVGSYDRRVVWWDHDLGTKPYKTLQYHDKAVRKVVFHPGRFHLLASASDDGSVSVLHAKVYSDLMQNPLIVPVKKLRGHEISDGFGVLDCAWHPSQPWLFTSGADSEVFMWS